MIKELYSEGVSENFEDAERRVTEFVNRVCKNILFNTAVFKNDDNGYKGFKKFLSCVGVK